MANLQDAKIFSVSEFISFLNGVLRPQKAIIQGEIGEKIDRYGSYNFFNLLDKETKVALKCFVWQNVLTASNIELKAGDEVKLFGYPEIFERRGNFSFQVKHISLIGEGRLKEAFEKLKKKLAIQGFFAPERKKQIPSFPEKIGLITSKSGRGALPDFRKHVGEYGIKIYFYDIRVEGLHAMNEITEAIHCFNENLPDIDVLVLVRGGGSWESLQPFNSEPVAKSILASKIPVICGVGHESDRTIAGYTADLRVSTPTEAGKVLSENWQRASVDIIEMSNIISSLMKRLLHDSQEQLELLGRGLLLLMNKDIKSAHKDLKSFRESIISELKREISGKSENLRDFLRNLNLSFQSFFKEFDFSLEKFKNNTSILQRAFGVNKIVIGSFSEKLPKTRLSWFVSIKQLIAQQQERLRVASPTLKIRQGYTITTNDAGEMIKRLNQVKVGETIKTKLYKGQILSQVKEQKDK